MMKVKYYDFFFLPASSPEAIEYAKCNAFIKLTLVNSSQLKKS